ncbi:FixH family protein [uncultured Massilia sp.]|uniref:FixH family protein n=1 Tax=uncultured Massilia sp. TaxID=169973 RepID=UPI0025FA8DCE|nr:FixH family protein [uncultured Massilia sp.]
MHAIPNPATPASARGDADPWYKHRWPWFLMLGPVSAMAFTGIAVLMSFDYPDAVVVDDYYKQGKAINQDLRRDRVATSLRLSLRASYVPAEGRLKGSIASAGKPLTVPFTIYLVHPTLPGKDIALLVRPDTAGAFAVDLPTLEPTHWSVVAEGALRDWRLARTWNGVQALTIDADRE